MDLIVWLTWFKVYRALGFWSEGREIIPPTKGDQRDAEAVWGEQNWGKETDDYADDITEFVDDRIWQKIIDAVDENLAAIGPAAQQPSQAPARKRIRPTD